MGLFGFVMSFQDINVKCFSFFKMNVFHLTIMYHKFVVKIWIIQASIKEKIKTIPVISLERAI